MRVEIKMKSFISNHLRVILVQIILLIVVFISWDSLNSKADVLSIAVIVDEEEGKRNPEVEVLKLYAQRINKYGGINGGKELHIKAYFGHNNEVRAKEIAEDIVKNKNIIAVVGDFTYKITQPIIDIYEKANLALLLRNSTLETNSSSIFQMSPSAESYGKYMAVYINKILKKKSVIIFHSERENDKALMASFTNEFKSLGGEVQNKILLSRDTHLETNLKENFESNNSDNVIVLIAGKEQSKKMIVALKRAGINRTIISKENSLKIDATIYKEEKNYAGYFSNNILSPVSIVRDNLNYDMASIIRDYENKYSNELIEQNSIDSLLSLMVIRVRITESLKNIDALRKDLNLKLKRSSAFDENQQVTTNSLIMGKFNRQYFATAPIAPTTLNLIELMEVNRSKLLELNGNSLYPTDTVSTGISMNKISEIDMENLSYKMDFFLWFRYKEGLKNVEDIEFLNAMKPVNLLDIVNNRGNSMHNIDINATLIESTLHNEQRYSLYHIIGDFKTSEAKNYALGRQNLYVKFRNRHINRYKLSYITDYFNTNRGLFSQEALKNNTLKRLKFDVIDEPSLTLNYNLSYISSSHKTMLGNPLETSSSDRFSQFTAQYSIMPTLWSIRGIESWINTQLPGGENKIEIPAMLLFLSLFMMIFIFTLYGHKKELFPNSSTYWWVLQLLIIFLILLFGEFALSQTIFDLKYSEWGNNHLDTINSLMQYMNKTIAVLWWIIPAYYITSAFEQFLWKPIKKQTGAEVPNVLRMFVTIIVYMLAIMGIMAFVFEVTVTSLAATSGVLAVMFAIASKVDISNIIAGLGISFSKVFKLGDWVKIGDVEGKVVEMTPRSTKVLTFDSSIINIPNTTVSSAIIENYTHPHKAYRLMIHLEIVPVYRFEHVEKVLLDAVTSTSNILDTPSPVVIFKGQGDSAQIFEIFFFIDDFSKKALLWQATWRRIWRHLEQANIALATPQREVFLPKASTQEIASPLTVLNNYAHFDDLSQERKEELSKKLIEKSYHEEEIILKSNSQDPSLFIITEGVVSFKNRINGKEFKRLGVAEVFDRGNVAIDVDVIAKTETKVFILKERE